MVQKRKRSLTPQQLKLCQLFLSGKTKVDSYLEAGYADQGSRRKNAIAAYERFKVESVQRYIAEFEGKVDEGLRRELGIDADDDLEDHQLADVSPGAMQQIVDPLDDAEVELLEETVLTRSGMLKRLELIADHAHRIRDYEGQIKPLQEIAKIMGFYRPAQVEVSAISFDLDLSGGKQLATDGLDPETVKLAQQVAPTLIGPASQKEREEEEEIETIFKESQVTEVDDLDDL